MSNNKRYYYRKNNNKNNNNNNNQNTNKKLTYDQIISSKSALDYNEKKDTIPVIRVIAFSLTILAIIFGSLLLFHII